MIENFHHSAELNGDFKDIDPLRAVVFGTPFVHHSMNFYGMQTSVGDQ